MKEELLVANGIDGRRGSYVLPPMPPAHLSRLLRHQGQDADPLLELKDILDRLRDGLGSQEGTDPKNLAEVGWGVVFPSDCDPAIRHALAPLLHHRREQATRRRESFYREFSGVDGYRSGESKLAWLARHGAGPGPADPEKVPYYLLLVGDPETLPFSFQYQLDVQYAVGRLDFETPEEYAVYSESVVAAETRGTKGGAPEPRKPRKPRKITFFGARNPDDLTTRLMADRLIASLEKVPRAVPGWQVESHVSEAATKARLGRLLGGEETPDLLFSACHGLGFDRGDPRQRRHQGALLCQDWPGPRAWQGPIPEDHYFSADDLTGESRLHGLIAFLYACHGAGTPRLDAFAHRVTGRQAEIAERSFIAGLPRRLLASPGGGALAVVGHVDRVWAFSYLWPGVGRNTQVFESTLRCLMKGHPVGFAMEYFGQFYAELATELSSELEAVRWGKKADDELLGGLWTANNDARSYLILGDPAVRLPG